MGTRGKEVIINIFFKLLILRIAVKLSSHYTDQIPIIISIYLIHKKFNGLKLKAKKKLQHNNLHDNVL